MSLFPRVRVPGSPRLSHFLTLSKDTERTKEEDHRVWKRRHERCMGKYESSIITFHVGYLKSILYIQEMFENYLPPLTLRHLVFTLSMADIYENSHCNTAGTMKYFFLIFRPHFNQICIFFSHLLPWITVTSEIPIFLHYLTICDLCFLFPS